MTIGAVFVSTGSFSGRPAESVGGLLDDGVEFIELSGGVPHPGLEESIKDLSNRAHLQLHNYFPPADPPFVFNLASQDDAIRSRTLETMKRAIEFSAAIGAERYSFHAGFLVDPPVSFLGRSWKSLERTDVHEAMSIFAGSVLELRELANGLGIRLLIENNVLTVGTRDQCGDDVLLMATQDQIATVMEQLPEDVGLLMDVAHLKVTAMTMGVDPFSELQDLSSCTKGYHLSDNDGRSDSNGPVTAESWFWPALDPSVEFATLEVAPRDGVDFKEQVQLTEELWHTGGSG